jgi:hypothetical protein
MLNLVPYTREWTSSVHEFNERMRVGGLENELRFPEELDGQFCQDSGSPLFREYFLAVEGRDVRGTYFITHEHWIVNGYPCRVASYRLPTSEGFINPKYKGLGRALLNHALGRNPFLYGLGYGDRNRPLARLVTSQGWRMVGTPFYFRCVHPRTVVQNLSFLRKRRSRRIMLDVVAWSSAWTGITALQRLRTRTPTDAATVSTVLDFGDWADDLWERARGTYSALSVRNLRLLRIRYPANDTRFIRMAIYRKSELCGWAVGLATTMHDHRHFGNLRVGTIVDCLAVPGNEHIVVDAAANVLEEHGTDLIVSNQSHRSWCTAFERAGFLSGPTNRFFTPSPELARLLEPFEQKFPLTHLTRGDAAGPVHL